MLVTKVMDTTAQIPVSAIIPRVTVVTPTPCVPTLKNRTSVDVPEGTKEMVGSAQTLMNALILMKMTVTSTPCVRTLKELMFVVVKRDILEMVETAQILMNVRAQMNVSSMRCAPIQRALTSVDVEKVSRAMEEIVQLLYPVVPQLVVQTLSARKTLEPLRAFVK